jgi:hypothetical protein
MDGDEEALRARWDSRPMAISWALTAEYSK